MNDYLEFTPRLCATCITKLDNVNTKHLEDMIEEIRDKMYPVIDIDGDIDMNDDLNMRDITKRGRDNDGEENNAKNRRK